MTSPDSSAAAKGGNTRIQEALRVTDPKYPQMQLLVLCQQLTGELAAERKRADEAESIVANAPELPQSDMEIVALLHRAETAESELETMRKAVRLVQDSAHMAQCRLAEIEGAQMPEYPIITPHHGPLIHKHAYDALRTYAMRVTIEAKADKTRMDWLERMFVTVRTPLRYGSRECFMASPDDLEDADQPSDLRQRIDAELAKVKT